MKHVFENAIANVNAAYPSIYTKEDVVKLIQSIQSAVQTVEEEREIAASVEVPYEEFTDALSDIKVAIRNHIKKMDFNNFLELELGYDNQIHINVNEWDIAEDIEEAFERSVAALSATKK